MSLFDGMGRHIGLLLLVLGVAGIIGGADRGSGTVIVLGFTLTLVGLMLALERRGPGERG